MIIDRGDEIQPISLGVRENKLQTAHSAFHSEIIALDLTVDILVSVLGNVDNF